MSERERYPAGVPRWVETCISRFGWQPEPFGPPAAQMTLWRLPGYVGGEAQQLVPRDVVAVMAPSGDVAAAMPPHWNVNLRVAVTRTRAALARTGARTCSGVGHPGRVGDPPNERRRPRWPT